MTKEGNLSKSEWFIKFVLKNVMSIHVQFRLFTSTTLITTEFRDYSENRSFKEEQAFIGYQKDTPAAVIFQASRQLKQLRRGNCQELDSLQKYSIFQDIHLPTISTEQKGSYWWKLAVSCSIGLSSSLLSEHLLYYSCMTLFA